MGTSDNKEEINSQIFVMLHTDHIGWCKSIYHTIMTTMPHPTIGIPPYIIGQSWVVFFTFQLQQDEYMKKNWWKWDWVPIQLIQLQYHQN
jgi:hypothetical protein